MACRPLGSGEFLLRVPPHDLTVGDRVTVEVPLPGPWRGILLIFGLPLAALVAGLLVGSSWPALYEGLGLGAEATGIVLGAVLAVASFAVAAAVDRRFRHRNQPRVVHVEHEI